MPEIDGVPYGDVAFEFMAEIAAKRTLDGDLPGTLANEAAFVHEIHRQFPGVKMLTDEERAAFLARPSQRPGRFYGRDATATERASGEAVEAEDLGPLKSGSAAHSVLVVYGDGRRRTSYQASLEACDDFHARRRESTRLLTRGFLVKSGTLPNPAPGGREHVDAYTITAAGRAELERLSG